MAIMPTQQRIGDDTMPSETENMFIAATNIATWSNALAKSLARTMELDNTPTDNRQVEVEAKEKEKDNVTYKGLCENLYAAYNDVNTQYYNGMLHDYDWPEQYNAKTYNDMYVTVEKFHKIVGATMPSNTQLPTIKEDRPMQNNVVKPIAKNDSAQWRKCSDNNSEFSIGQGSITVHLVLGEPIHKISDNPKIKPYDILHNAQATKWSDGKFEYTMKTYIQRRELTK